MSEHERIAQVLEGVGKLVWLVEERIGLLAAGDLSVARRHLESAIVDLLALGAEVQVERETSTDLLEEANAEIEMLRERLGELAA